MKNRVIIIGTGAAGLMAAKVLKEKGTDFIILESTDHVGGRAQTLKGNPHIEYGPEFLHGETPVTDMLMDEYHIPSYDLKFDYHLYLNGKLTPLPDFWERMGAILGHIKNLKKDMPFTEYLETYDHHSKIDQEITKLFVEGFDAADLDQVSTKALKEMQDQVTDPDARKMRRPLHGYGELMEKMAQDVLSHVRFHHVVDEIIWEKEKVYVRGLNGLERFEILGNRVLDTVSIGVLKRQHIHPMPQAMSHWLEQVEMGQVVKLVAELEPEFFHLFKDHSFPFVSAPELHFSAWWPTTPIHFPIVTAWAGGERARKLSILTDKERKKIFIEELAIISSQSAKKIESWMEKIHYHDWSHDQSFLGAYSYPKVRDGEKARMQTSFEKTLFFAGEAFHEEMSGTIEGALATGKRAAEKIING